MAWAGPAIRPAAFANAILGTGLSDDPWILPYNPNMSGNLSSMDVAGGIAGGDPDHFVYGDKLVQENFLVPDPWHASECRLVGAGRGDNESRR